MGHLLPGACALLLLLPGAAAAQTLTFSVNTDASLDGVTFRDDDVVTYDLGTGSVDPELLFEGSHENLEDIDALHVLPDGSLLLSVTGSAVYATAGGSLSIRDGDIARIDALSGLASPVLFFDEDLLPEDVDIDALYVLESGNLLFSTRSDVLGFEDDDVLEYDFAGAGVSLFFDGASAFGFADGEDVMALGFDDTGRLLLSTSSPAQVGSNALALEPGDLIALDLSSGVARLLFEGSVLLRDPDDPTLPAGVILDAAHLSLDGASDGDADGVVDGFDNCPGIWNPEQEDSDGNGLGDACNDAQDADGDDFADHLDVCPEAFDPDQEDADGDGIGDACDPFPDSADHALAQCQVDLAQAEAHIDRLLHPKASCGLGGELCLLLPAIFWLRARWRRRA